MDRMMMGHRQQETALQLLTGGLELHTAPRSFSIEPIGDILPEHGPSWVRNARRNSSS
jgi:hypothetical protein